MCTSNPTVRRWMADAMAHVFRTRTRPGRSVHHHGFGEPDELCLGTNPRKNALAANTATMPISSPRSMPRSPRGSTGSTPTPKVIVWDWGWHGHREAPDVIAKLPDSVWLKSVSEWAMPIERGGVKTTVGEYSISAVGPGPRALRHWQLAKESRAEDRSPRFRSTTRGSCRAFPTCR